MNQSIAFYDYHPGMRYIGIRVRRNTAIAVFISLAIHGIVLFAFSAKKLIAAMPVVNLHPKNLSVLIVGPPSRKSLPLTPHTVKKSDTPYVKPKRRLPAPSVIALGKNAIIATPQPVLKIPSAANNNAPTDLMSYIKTKRQHSQDFENNAARENAVAIANARMSSNDEQREENIKNNLQQQGLSGIFEIRQISLRRGQFSFRGWKNDYSNSRVELIDVEAGTDGNIELAIVRKMIEIIRREYKGDFNWESQRLGRVIVLSARLEDNTGLEEFLMRDFFGTHGP